jgi:hypothetical protein
MPSFIEGNGNIYLGFGQAQKYGRDKPNDISQTVSIYRLHTTTKQSKEQKSKIILETPLHN